MTTPSISNRPWKPYWTPITQRRENLRRLGQLIRTPQEFHILGAGVTGLAAAIEILELPLPNGQRHSVTLYEGSDRVGGRINTKRLGPPPPNGQPDTRPYFERGAMRIPTCHDYTWAYAQEGKLQRRRFLNDERSHDFQGKVYRPTDLEALARAYGVRDPEAHRGPGYLFGKNVLEPEMLALDRAYGGQDNWAPLVIEGRIEGAALERIDRLDLKQVLEQRLQPTDPGQVKFLADLNFPGLLDRAFLMFVRSWLVNRGDLYELCRDHGGGTVVGGMELLVKAMQERVETLAPKSIRLERPVVGITTGRDNAWQVDFDGHEPIRRDGRRNRHLLCTLPFSIVRELRLSGFSGAKTEAIHRLSMAHAAKVALHVEERFWEKQPYGVKGGRSLNDRLSRAHYYPNDHNPVCAIGAQGEPEGHYDLYTQPSQTLSTTDATALAAEASRPGPWLMLSSYTFGEHAEAVGKPGRKASDTVPDVERIFGAFKVQEAESEIWYWNDPQQARWAKGPFALPEPRNISRYYQAARRPDGDVYFAGDHLSPEPGWIQGSLLSSLLTTQQLLLSAIGGEATTEVPAELAEVTA